MIRNTKFNSFMGQVMYDQLVSEKHFLRRLNNIMMNGVDLTHGIFQVHKGEFRYIFLQELPIQDGICLKES